MAIAFKATIGTGQSQTSSTSLVITTTAAVAVGDWIIVAVAADNTGTSTPTITCADSGGNAYTADVSNGVGTSGNGVRGYIFSAPCTVALSVGATITATLSAAVTAKAGIAQTFVGVNTRKGSGTASATGTSTTAAVTSVSAATGELVYAAAAIETRTDPTAYDTDTSNGSWSTGAVVPSATGGSDPTRVQIVYQYKIVTGAGTQAYGLTNTNTEWVAMTALYTVYAGVALAITASGTGTSSGSVAIIAGQKYPVTASGTGTSSGSVDIVISTPGGGAPAQLLQYASVANQPPAGGDQVALPSARTAGSTIVAFLWRNETHAAITGGGLTWTKQQQAGPDVFTSGYFEAWTAPNPSSTSTITVDFGHGGSSFQWFVGVVLEIAGTYESANAFMQTTGSPSGVGSGVIPAMDGDDGLGIAVMVAGGDNTVELTSPAETLDLTTNSRPVSMASFVLDDTDTFTITGTNGTSGFSVGVGSATFSGSAPTGPTSHAITASGTGTSSGSAAIVISSAPVAVLGTPVSGGAAVQPFNLSLVVPAGTDRVAFACVGIDASSGTSTPGVSSNLDGAFTQVTFLAPATNNQGVAVFYKVNPTVGTHTLTYSATGFASTIAGTAICFEHVDQTTPYTGLQTFAGTSTATSLAVTTQTGDMVVDFACINGAPTITVGAAQTAQGGTPASINAGNTSIAMSTQAGVDGGAMTWTWSGAQRAGAVGFSVKQATGVGAPTSYSITASGTGTFTGSAAFGSSSSIVLYSAFSGTNGDAWPSPWTIRNTTASIQSNRGRLAPTTTGYNYCTAHTTGIDIGDVRVEGIFRLSSDTLEQYPAIGVRHNGSWAGAIVDRGIILYLDVAGDRIDLQTIYAGANVGSISGGATVAWQAGVDYRFTIEVVEGTGLTRCRAKVWPITGFTQEPAGWMIQGTTSHVNRPASGGMSIAMTNGVSGTPYLEVDDIIVQDDNNGRLRLLPVGDSITAGPYNFPGNVQPTWRKYVYDYFESTATPLQMVGQNWAPGTVDGSGNGGTYTGMGTWDHDHHARNSWWTTDVLVDVDDDAVNYQPDIAVLYIGLNDLLNASPAATTLTNVGSIITALRAGRADVKIVLCQIAPNTAGISVTTFNSGLVTLAAAQTTGGSPIAVADCNTGFNTAWLYDTIHFDVNGDAFLAGRIETAIETVLAAGGPTSHAITAAGTGTSSGSAAISIPGAPTSHPITASGTGTSAGSAAIAIVGVGTVYSDDFNRADGAVGASWVNMESATLAVSGNKVTPAATTTGCFNYYDVTVGADQWSEITVTFPPAGHSMGPSVRMSGAVDGNVYYSYFNFGSMLAQVWKRAGGTYSQIGSSVAFTGFTHTIRLEAEGTTIRLYIDGTKTHEITDSSTSSGRVGLVASATSGQFPVGDNWRGGALPYVPSAVVVYSDDFNRANGALTTPWVAVDGTLSIVSNQVASNTGLQVSYYNETFAADQWVEADITGFGPTIDGNVVPCLRVNGSDFYYLWSDFSGSNNVVITKRVGGTYTNLSGTGSSAPASFKARLEIEGTTLRAYINGTLALTTTDASISSGRPGLLAGGTGATADNFRAGDLPYVPVVYSDNFDRANGAIGSPWVSITGAFAISGNKAAVTANGDAQMRYDTTVGNNQWAEGDVVIAPTGANAAGVAVRLGTSTSTPAYYSWCSSDGLLQLWKRDSGGTYTQLGSNVVTALSFKVRVEAEGTTVRMFKDNVQVISVTDSTATTGQVGLFGGNYSGTVPSVDNWRGGDMPYTSLSVPTSYAITASGLGTFTGSVSITIPGVPTSYPITASGTGTSSGSVAITVPGAPGGVAVLLQSAYASGQPPAIQDQVTFSSRTANSTLVACMYRLSTSSGVTGGGLTWTQRDIAGPDPIFGSSYIEVWTAPNPTATSAITVDYGHPGGFTFMSMLLLEVQGTVEQALAYVGSGTTVSNVGVGDVTGMDGDNGLGIAILMAGSDNVVHVTSPAEDEFFNAGLDVSLGTVVLDDTDVFDVDGTNDTAGYPWGVVLVAVLAPTVVAHAITASGTGTTSGSAGILIPGITYNMTASGSGTSSGTVDIVQHAPTALVMTASGVATSTGTAAIRITGVWTFDDDFSEGLTNWSQARFKSQGLVLAIDGGVPAHVAHVDDYLGDLNGVTDANVPNDVFYDATDEVLYVGCGSQNYGDTLLRCKQPFDFSTGAGIIEVDLIPTLTANTAENAANPLRGYTQMMVTSLPYAAPNCNDDNSAGPTAKYGFAVRFDYSHVYFSGVYHPAPIVMVWDDHAETKMLHAGPGTTAAVGGAALTARIEFTHTHISVYVGEDLWYDNDWDLPPELTRGHVYIGAHNHAAIKYAPFVQSFNARFKGVRFDGRDLPATSVSRVADSLTPSDFPNEGGVGVATGYVFPTGALSLPGVPSKVKAARLVMNVMTNPTNPDPETFALVYSLNGNTSHSVAFEPLVTPARSGEAIFSFPVAVSELVAGGNTVSLSLANHPTTGHMAFAASIQLVTEPSDLIASGTGTFGGSVAIAIFTPPPVSYPMTASGTGTFDGSAAFGQRWAVSASGTGLSDGAVALRLRATVSASGTGLSDGTATLRRIAPLTASGIGASDGSAAIATTVRVTGSGTGLFGGSVALGISWRITASGTGASTGSGAIAITSGAQVRLITASGTGVSDGSVALRLRTAVSAAGIGTFDGSVALRLRLQIRASGTGTFTGEVEIRVPGERTGIDVALTVGELRADEWVTVGEMVVATAAEIAGFDQETLIDDFASVAAVDEIRRDEWVTVADVDDGAVIGGLEASPPVIVGGFEAAAVVEEMREDK